MGQGSACVLGVPPEVLSLFQSLCRYVQLHGDDPVCVWGKAPPSVWADCQLQRGQLRLSDSLGALRPMLLALYAGLPPPRTQYPLDSTGRNPVPLPGDQRGGAEWRGSRPHVLRRPATVVQILCFIRNSEKLLSYCCTDTFGLEVHFTPWRVHNYKWYYWFQCQKVENLQWTLYVWFSNLLPINLCQ